MNINKVNNDTEAWNFLLNNTKEFRIHTNKNGLKVFIKVLERKYTGYWKFYHVRVKPNFTTSFIHRNDFEEVVGFYRESMQGQTLTEVVNKHIDNFPGDIDRVPNCFEDSIKRGFCEFDGSLEEFKKLIDPFNR